jgi:DNA-directed RNA polymerase subunit RPC12/RpoP
VNLKKVLQMKTTLIALLVSLFALIIFTACASEKQQQSPVQVEDNSNRFRTINAGNSSRQVGSQTVVCHNCTAQFKLSQKIQKMSMKGDAIVDCPVCHHNYLKKAKKE